MTTPIIISHSEKDKLLADALMRLLVLGAAANTNEIFCSSLDGMDIPKGNNFCDFIKEKFQQPKLVIILLTPNYYESIFCICELGASWVLSLGIFPILVPPLDYDDVKAVLEGIEVAKIDNEGDMNELKDRASQVLARNSSTAMWAKTFKEFFEKLPSIIAKLPKPNKIGLCQYSKLEEKFRATEVQLENAQKRIQELKELNAKLIPAKDKEEVTRIVTEQMGKWSIFQEFVKAVQKKMNLLQGNYVAMEAVFHYVAGTDFIIHRFDDDLREELSEAVNGGFVVFDQDTNEVQLRADDPAVNDFLENFNLLKQFINEADSEFREIFIEKYKVKPDVSNKRFWEILDLL